MCDEYLQKDLWSNIVVAGGTSMLPYFAERMRYELDVVMETEGVDHALQVDCPCNTCATLL
jgi:actin-related protein